MDVAIVVNDVETLRVGMTTVSTAQSLQHFRCRGRMNHHSPQGHVFTTLKTRPAVHPKAVPQQLRPQGVSTSGCVCGASPQRFERLGFGGFGHNRRVKWGIPWGARALDVIVMAE